MTTLSLEETILNFYNVEGLKFGKFTMRTGEISPVYVDMRVIWTYPDIVRSVSELIWEKAKNLQFDLICGLPYQGIPLATYLSTKYDIPMLLKRQTTKTYGTCKMVEGNYKPGDRVLIIDDVLMTGGTLIKDIPVLEAEGLEVVGSAVFLDRAQGGAERTKHATGKDTHSVVTLPEIFKMLKNREQITQSQVDIMQKYLQENRFDTEQSNINVTDICDGNQ